MVYSGSTLTFSVDGSTGGVFRPEVSVLRAQVIARLSQFFAVRTVDITIRSIIGSIMVGELWNYEYQATVVITTRMDYGHVDDVGSIVANAFYVAGGALPTVSTSAHDGPFGGVNEQGPGGFFEDVGRSVTELPRLVVFGVIAVVAIVAFSPLGKAGVRVSAV